MFFVLFFLVTVQYGSASKNGPCPFPDLAPSGIQNVGSGDNTAAYNNLKLISKQIKKSCGSVCDTSQTGVTGKYYNAMWKDIQCHNLFSETVFDKPSEFFRPTKTIPKYIFDDFTYNGRVNTVFYYMDDSKVYRHVEWTEVLIENLRIAWRNKTYKGFLYYEENIQDIYRYLTTHMNISGQHVLVVGTEKPWLEALILEAGAKKVTTLEYAQIQNYHPLLETLTHADFSKQFLDGTLPQFDAVVSFSSLEHSGLGRYGDQLNPWGDLITMAKIWCALRPGGLGLIGVPTGPDTLMFNINRIYGPLMYSHLFSNWKQIYTEAKIRPLDPACLHCYQPLHVIKKVLNAEEL